MRSIGAHRLCQRLAGENQAAYACVHVCIYLSIAQGCQVVGVSVPACCVLGGRKKTAVGLGLGVELSQCPALLEIPSGLFLSAPPFHDRWKTNSPFLSTVAPVSAAVPMQVSVRCSGYLTVFKYVLQAYPAPLVSR